MVSNFIAILILPECPMKIKSPFSLRAILLGNPKSAIYLMFCFNYFFNKKSTNKCYYNVLSEVSELNEINVWRYHQILIFFTLREYRLASLFNKF